MAFRRGVTPTGVPSLEASNQSQIEDLVIRNRTLEHTNHKLNLQLAEEINRSKAFMKEIQGKHDVNQRQWKEGCQDILASYRIIQKKLEVEVERERTANLREMEATRHEKLQRLQRDYKIKLFQMQEEELEIRMEEVEYEKSILEENYEIFVEKLKEMCAEYAVNLKDAREALAQSEEERKEEKEKLKKLRESHANLDANEGTFKATLKRTQLTLEREQDKNTELAKELNDVKRRNKDLTKQLEGWQNLEHSESAEVESQRRQLTSLQRQLQELTDVHEKDMDVLRRTLEKEQERLETCKEAKDNWEQEAKGHIKEVEKVNNLLKKMEKKMENMKEELEIERARVRAPSAEESQAQSDPQESIPDEIQPDEALTKRRGRSVKASSKPPPPTIKAGPSKKFKGGDSDAPKKQVARKRTGGRPPKPIEVAIQEQDSDIEEIPNPKGDEDDPIESRNESKGKAKAIAVEENEPQVEMKRVKKRKTSEEDEDDLIETIEQPKPKRGARGASQLRNADPARNRGRSKPASRAGSRQPVVRPGITDHEQGDQDEDGDATQKKKKRKINIFPVTGTGATPVLPSFGTSLLDIPSYLSPVKEDEPVPQRSISLVGSLSNLIKHPFKR